MPPDPDRRILSTVEYKRELGRAYRHVEAAERRASDDVATYYAFRPRPGLELISLDTVAEGGGSNGNLDDPQYRWLEGKLKQAERADRLVIAYGHHTLGTLDNTRTDEQAGACTPPKPGCDADPRKLDAAPPRPEGQEDRARPVPALPERDRLRRRPHAREPHRPLPQGQLGLLADQHRLARRLAAAEPADRADGQRRRHAVAVRDGARPGRPDRRARARHGGRVADRRPAREPRRACWRSTTRSAPGPTRSAARWTATWSSCCATRGSSAERRAGPPTRWRSAPPLVEPKLPARDPGWRQCPDCSVPRF